MCGLAGIINLAAPRSQECTFHILKGMADAISYRGPDDEQYHIDSKVGFAFRRLSILDLVNGQQPFLNEDGSIVVMVNGEIYNYKELKASLHNHMFKTTSDCEVIVHLYEEKGIGFVDDIIGMFSIAIWDKNKNKVFLVRDRFGIKPLFYTELKHELIFASEIKSLFSHPHCPRQFNWKEALSDIWLSGEAASNHKETTSFFVNIQNLDAGHYLEINLTTNERKTASYWSLQDILLRQGYRENLHPDDLIEGYRELLADSVHRCLQSDVEVGLFLSGGIDSAAVAHFAAEKQDLHTFTVLSQSTFTNEDAKYAHWLAKDLHLPNHQVLYQLGNDELLQPESYKHLLWICETPFCGPEQLYKFHLHKYAKAIRPNLKVMLTGQGSDEFNGGYSTTLSPAENPSWEGFIESVNTMEMNRLHRLQGNIFRVWEEHFGLSPINLSYLKSNDSSQTDPWQSYVLTKYRDLQMYNCWHEDRIAAANHIENRVPFLDHRLVEWVCGIPDGLRKDLLWDKSILRKSLTNELHTSYTHRPKVPFFYGKDVRYTHKMMFHLLKKNNYQLIEEAFSHSDASSIIQVEHIHAIMTYLEDDPEFTNFEFLLRLVNMGLLSKMTKETPSVQLDITSHLESITIKDWHSQEGDIASRLNISANKCEGQDILALNPGVTLLRPESDSEHCIYIAEEGFIQFIVSEEDVGAWLHILCDINGKDTLHTILDRHGVCLEEVAKYIQEAIEHNIILIKQKNLPEGAYR